MPRGAMISILGAVLPLAPVPALELRMIARAVGRPNRALVARRPALARQGKTDSSPNGFNERHRVSRSSFIAVWRRARGRLPASSGSLPPPNCPVKCGADGLRRQGTARRIYGFTSRGATASLRRPWRRSPKPSPAFDKLRTGRPIRLRTPRHQPMPIPINIPRAAFRGASSLHPS